MTRLSTYNLELKMMNVWKDMDEALGERQWRGIEG